MLLWNSAHCFKGDFSALSFILLCEFPSSCHREDSQSMTLSPPSLIVPVVLSANAFLVLQFFSVDVGLLKTTLLLTALHVWKIGQLWAYSQLFHFFFSFFFTILWWISPVSPIFGVDWYLSFLVIVLPCCRDSARSRSVYSDMWNTSKTLRWEDWQGCPPITTPWHLTLILTQDQSSADVGLA